jgi:hypothetical protein
MVARALVLLTCVLLLGACSDSAEDSGSGEPRWQTALEDLTPERLCELLPDDAIKQALDLDVKDTKGTKIGRPPILIKTCRYSVEFALAEVDTLPPAVTTGVGQIRDKSVDEVLDDAFTDITDESKPVGDYERVDGLGDDAGYGTGPLGGGTLDESLLVVVFTAGDEQFKLDLTVSPKTPLEQLKPLATDLLTGLAAELG